MSIADVFSTEVLSRSELLGAGFGDAEIRAAIAAGWLTRLHHGVYAAAPAAAGTARPVEVLRILGVGRRSPSMVISHASAAVLHRLPLWRTDPNVVHLTRPPGGGAVRRSGRTIHSAWIPDIDIVERNGLRVTSVARTVVDLARSCPFESAVIACDYALHEGLVSPDSLRAALDEAHGRPGRRAAVRALTFADGRAESPGESRTRVLMLRAGLPAPDLQIEVRDRAGTFLGRADLGYSEHAALIEFDGKVKYQKELKPGQTASAAVIAEKQREDAIRAAGTVMVRIVWSELGGPAAVIARIEEACRQGRLLRSAGIMSGSLRPRVPVRMQ